MIPIPSRPILQSSICATVALTLTALTLQSVVSLAAPGRSSAPISLIAKAATAHSSHLRALPVIGTHSHPAGSFTVALIR